MKLRLHQMIALAFFAICGLILILNFTIGLHPYLAGALFFSIVSSSLVMLMVVPLPPPEILGLMALLSYFKTPPPRILLDEFPSFEIKPDKKQDLEYLHSQIEKCGARLFGAFQTEKSGIIWVYANNTQTIFWEVIMRPSGIYGVEIRTQFADGFLLLTLSNEVINLDTKHFYVSNFLYPEVAFDNHLHQITIQSIKHGKPLRFDNFADYLGDDKKHIRETKASNLAIATSLFSEGRRRILGLGQSMIMFLTLVIFEDASITFAITLFFIGYVFWIEDFTTAPLKVFQNGQGTRKRKGA